MNTKYMPQSWSDEAYLAQHPQIFMSPHEGASFPRGGDPG